MSKNSYALFSSVCFLPRSPTKAITAMAYTRKVGKSGSKKVKECCFTVSKNVSKGVVEVLARVVAE
jgi:hypothetical protein